MSADALEALAQFADRQRAAQAVATEEGTVSVASQIVKYQLDDSLVVGFEVEAGPGWHQAGAKEFVGQVRNAVTPAVEAAKEVLEKVKEIKPGSVEVKFGVKVTGEANWVVARAATEGSFEITLTWKPGPELSAAEQPGQAAATE